MIDYISPLPDQRWQTAWPRSVSILGSTGSIGRSALEVLRLEPEKFTVTALAGAMNVPLLTEQALEFRPRFLAVQSPEGAAALRARLPKGYTPEILVGQDGYETLASLPEADIVLSAQVGAAGLRATVAAAEAGKVIALANKESLVLAGSRIRALCAATGAVILPVDSEHNALFQCLAGNDAKAVSRIILTASGGPFRGKTRGQMADVTVEAALAHPNWSMGAKITIDSATMMNKGLELIEAHHLYGLALERIEVVVHKESIVHSLVEYRDGSQLAQLGSPDMRVPIAHCLGWPQRLATGVKRLDLAACGTLTFAAPDEEAFPALGLAKRALREGGGYPVVLNAANEEAVAAFLAERIGYLGIADLVERALDVYKDVFSGAYAETSIPASAYAEAQSSAAGRRNATDAADAHPAASFSSEPLATTESILTLDAHTRHWCRAHIETMRA